MESKTFKELNQKLVEAGALENFIISQNGIKLELSNPIEIFANTKKSALKYENILLEYAKKLEENELEIVIRSMTEKGFNNSVHFLFSLFEKKNISDLMLWAAGNALNVINDKRSYNKIIILCKNKKLGQSREMLIHVLPKIKSEIAFDTLIELLDDKSIRGHVIEALGNFGRSEAVKFIEPINVDKSKYEYKSKVNSLRKLKKTV